MGRRLVMPSLALGHPTYILHRREIGLDIDKLQIFLDFKRQEARLVEVSFSDHRSLVDAVKLVDVVKQQGEDDVHSVSLPTGKRHASSGGGEDMGETRRKTTREYFLLPGGVPLEIEGRNWSSHSRQV
ncbi:hypothetical protein EJ110_NYTH33837 [Nymphaea thermarum]|nr:hypothetical protein EJ110_NYTH33837 [Nymphaea thermarum]